MFWCLLIVDSAQPTFVAEGELNNSMVFPWRNLHYTRPEWLQLNVQFVGKELTVFNHVVV